MKKLRQLGAREEADKLADQFIEERGLAVGQFDPGIDRPIEDPKLQAAVEEASRRSKADMRPFAEVLEAIVADEFGRENDIRRLAERPVSDYVDFFTSTERKHLTTVARKLANLADAISNPSMERKLVQEKMREAVPRSHLKASSIV